MFNPKLLATLSLIEARMKTALEGIVRIGESGQGEGYDAVGVFTPDAEAAGA